ncbi:hypothetical protein [Clostridium botulinum]|uniref:hypothetical protein n=1 Tax=Clostridium botulinum TaxID=1491 RepID=UPI003DA39AB2
MEKSSFFNAIIDQNGTPDRAYLAEDFAKYFSAFIGNGVFPNPANQLQVIAIDNNMQIRIKAGLAWINGYLYENTDDYIFKLDTADGVLNRIDRIALRLDFLERRIKAVVKKGQYGSNPIAPVLQRDVDAYELAIADIYVKAGVIAILQSNITDTRLNSNVCGIVHGTIKQVDTTEIFRQYQAWFLENKSKHEKDFEVWMNEFKIATGKKFTDWVDDLKNSLDPNEDIAARLQMQISENKLQLADMATYQTAGGTATSINLNLPTLVNGYATTFIVSSNNNKNVTTINGKKLYKPNTTTTPNLTTGKAVSVWYNATKDCFFIKASSEGTAVAANVLANKTFSNDNDTGLTGSMADRGVFNLNLGATVPAGYYSGGTVPKGRGYSTGDRTLRASRGNSLLPITGLSFTPSKVIVNTYYVNTRGYKQASYQITSNTSDMYNNYGRSIYGIFGYRGEGNPGQFSHDTTGTNIFGNGFNIILNDIYDSYDVVLRYWAFE